MGSTYIPHVHADALVMITMQAPPASRLQSELPVASGPSLPLTIYQMALSKQGAGGGGSATHKEPLHSPQ